MSRGPNDRILNAARILLFVLSGALIVLGVLNGGARDVFYKAAAVCSECIGLG